MKDVLRYLPLKTKLLATVAVAFLVLVTVLVSSLKTNLDTMKVRIVTQTQEAMEAEVLGRLSGEAGKLGNQIGGYIDSVMRIPITLSNTLFKIHRKQSGYFISRASKRTCAKFIGCQ